MTLHHLTFVIAHCSLIGHSGFVIRHFPGFWVCQPGSLMKFAFSTIACPAWDFETIAARAKEYGYDGVEVRGFLNESILTAANVFLTSAAKVRSIFESQGIAIACLGSS